MSFQPELSEEQKRAHLDGLMVDLLQMEVDYLEKRQSALEESELSCTALVL